MRDMGRQHDAFPRMHNMGFALNKHCRLPFQNIYHRIARRRMLGQLFARIESE
ncbi:Hypothetical protein PYTT_0660 [Akkermansia glycaniphila]|uniref:Uncharacterized protein n=1 Tax=Akkermansia glycaniphila TaxID=1679444 RepID=A0A1H6KPE7_9BACT|nr:Hypothetical protein PYTT_0660 [Akkermansia glycaniphila]